MYVIIETIIGVIPCISLVFCTIASETVYLFIAHNSMPRSLSKNLVVYTILAIVVKFTLGLDKGVHLTNQPVHMNLQVDYTTGSSIISQVCNIVSKPNSISHFQGYLYRQYNELGSGPTHPTLTTNGNTSLCIYGRENNINDSHRHTHMYIYMYIQIQIYIFNLSLSLLLLSYHFPTSKQLSTTLSKDCFTTIIITIDNSTNMSNTVIDPTTCTSIECHHIVLVSIV